MAQTTKRGALGKFLSLLMGKEKYDVSKYNVEYASMQHDGKKVVRAGVSHAQLSRITSGEFVTPTYETVWRALDGIEKATDAALTVSTADRVDTIAAAFSDRVSYEAGKYMVYKIYAAEGKDERIPQALIWLRDAIIDGELVREEPGKDQPETLPEDERKGKRLLRKAIPFMEATGFELVRQMAEMPQAHQLRMQLVTDRMGWLVQDWEADISKHGDLHSMPVGLREARDRRDAREELRGMVDYRNV